METIEIFQVIVYFALLIAAVPMLGNYMFKVFTGEKHILSKLLGPLENLLYRILKVKMDDETGWKEYTFSLLAFNLIGFIFLFIIQLIQSFLPLNPGHLSNVSWHSALNTAVSFVTNTNWQSYAGETTLSYFVQMAGLTVQNFLSASTGIAVLLALTRGLARVTTDKIGNFTVDLTRSTLYVLLPLSVLSALLLVSQGVIQNFREYVPAHTLSGSVQIIPMGPVASQEAIKQVGTNGGGFFNSNSSHPFENPTPISNFIEMLFILLIPAALTYTFGKMISSVKHGWVIFATMFILLLAGLFVSLHAEFSSNPIFGNAALMEGKETRFGITGSVLWSTLTTAASNGSVNAMHDSLSPLAGMTAIINIILGEIIFGGVGSGMYGMIIFIILTVFIAGLMVGRTPEYLGKKIDAFEVKMAILAILAPAFVILIFTAWAVSSPYGLEGLNNNGPHGFSEILYAFSSAAGNNGSAFAGLSANTRFYNLTTAAGMIIGRFGVIIPVMAIAGSLARKKITPSTAGTFRTDNLLFPCLLIAVILIVGGLTFFPALSLGPLIDHLIFIKGTTF